MEMIHTVRYLAEPVQFATIGGNILTSEMHSTSLQHGTSVHIRNHSTPLHLASLRPALTLLPKFAIRAHTTQCHVSTVSVGLPQILSASLSKRRMGAVIMSATAQGGKSTDDRVQKVIDMIDEINSQDPRMTQVG